MCCFQPAFFSPFKDGSPALPIGKKHHIFVSHSTADKKVVRERLVLPLREMCGFIVNACYHFMTPDESRYEDSGISQAFNDSCVLIIALSKQYLSSARLAPMLYLYLCI